MRHPDLSIIIVNWNTRELLRDCLTSVPAAADGLDYEVLVVDNDSRDGSVAMVREAFPDVRVLEAGANLGFARANNLALRLAGGRAVLLLNPDTVCRPGALATLLAAADASPGYGAFGPLLIDRAGAPVTSHGAFPSARFHWLRPFAGLPLGRRWRRWTRFTHVPRPDDPAADVDYVAGACLLIPRAALERVGPLDERFFLYFEETDWCLRAWRAGLPVRFYPAAVVVHLEGQAAELVSRFSLTQFQASYRLFVAKHRGPQAVRFLRLSIFFEKILQAVWHGVACWSPRRRKLFKRYWYEAWLQRRGELAPAPPVAADRRGPDPGDE